MDLDITAFRKWGKKGGETRAKSLSPKRRKAIARRAARARWKKRLRGGSK